MSYEIDITGNMIPTPEAARLEAERERTASGPSDTTACSRIVGYRLEAGIDKAELYFLPGRPTQKTLDRMSDLIGDGWMVTGIIYSENERGLASAPQDSDS